MLTGAGLIWVVRVVGTAALRKEAMGFGDVTLMGMVGSFLGWQAVVMVFFMAPFMGLLVGLVEWLRRGNNVLPYGPYLSMAAVLNLLFWNRIWQAVEGHFEILSLVPASIAVLGLATFLVPCVLINVRRAGLE